MKGEVFSQFAELSPAAIQPDGWLLEYLKRQQTGMSGHPEVHDYPFNTCLWNGVAKRKGKHGQDWWRYEQTAYLVDGLLSLGYLLKDKALIKKGADNVSYVMNNPQKNGRLGPVFESKSEWPFAVFFRAIAVQYSATGDKDIAESLRQHYLKTSQEQISLEQVLKSSDVNDKEGLGTTYELVGKDRNICTVEGLCKTYEWTGDTELLDKAVAVLPVDSAHLTMFASDDKIHEHGVTYMEKMKLPTIMYMYTGTKEYLDAGINAVRKLQRDHMLADGMPSSNEHLVGRDPLWSHETCDIADMTWSLGYLLMATGDGEWADMIEKACFNAAPGAVTKDFKALQYLSSVNQFIADDKSNHNTLGYGKMWTCYSPVHFTECCAGNVHRIMPNYAARMWMKSKDGGVVAALYGPSTLSTDKLKIHQKTSYPFAETIEFAFETEEPVNMPFYIRIPGWCTTPELTVNGSLENAELKPGTFVKLDRTFTDGDSIVLKLPMPIQLKRLSDAHAIGGERLSIEKGPLVYAYSIPEKVVIAEDHCAREKRCNNEEFPTYYLYPDGPWNFALDCNEQDVLEKIEVVERKNGGYPFEPGQSPVALRVPVKKVMGWELTDERFTSRVPLDYDLGESETITLEPYGATRLRLTSFPDATAEKPTRIAVKDWNVSPVYEYDPERPLAEQAVGPEKQDEDIDWKEMQADSDGFLHLEKNYEEERGIIFAKTHIEVQSDCTIKMFISHQNAAAVWINGQQQYFETKWKRPNNLARRDGVRLHAGKNDILVKVSRHEGALSNERLGAYLKVFFLME